jgi:hypothetical protein
MRPRLRTIRHPLSFVRNLRRAARVDKNAESLAVSPMPLMELAAGIYAFKALALATELGIFTDLSRDKHTTVADFAVRHQIANRPAELLLTAWARFTPQTMQSGGPDPRRQDRQERPLPQGRPGVGRRLGAAPTPSSASVTGGWPAGAAAQGPGRRRPVHPRHRMAPAIGPRRALPRSRRRLLHQPDRQEPQDPQPRPPAGGPRIHRRTHARRISPRQPWLVFAAAQS